MVLVGYGNNDGRLRVCEKADRTVCYSVITVHTLRKKREIKTVLVLTRFPCSLVPWRSLHWLNG